MPAAVMATSTWSTKTRLWRSTRAVTRPGDGLELLAGTQAVGRPGAEPGRHLVLEPGHPDLEELVETLGEDGEELGPLEEWLAPVGGQVQEPVGEVEPRQLAVGETPGRTRRVARGDVLGPRAGQGRHRVGGGGRAGCPQAGSERPGRAGVPGAIAHRPTAGGHRRVDHGRAVRRRIGRARRRLIAGPAYPARIPVGPPPSAGPGSGSRAPPSTRRAPVGSPQCRP